MSKKYKLTIAIGKVLTKLDNNFFDEFVCEYYLCDKTMHMTLNELVSVGIDDFENLYLDKEIRYVLNYFKDELGENPQYTYYKTLVATYEGDPRQLANYISTIERQVLTPQLEAEALCNRWLDGLEPMIDTTYEQVLEELLKVLEGIK